MSLSRLGKSLLQPVDAHINMGVSDGFVTWPVDRDASICSGVVSASCSTGREGSTDGRDGRDMKSCKLVAVQAEVNQGSIVFQSVRCRARVDTSQGLSRWSVETLNSPREGRQRSWRDKRGYL